MSNLFSTRSSSSIRTSFRATVRSISSSQRHALAASSSSSSSSSSSTNSPSSSKASWSRPIQEGALPAYDEALNLISSNSEKLRNQIQELKSKSHKSTPEGRATIQSLEIASQINDPKILWEFQNGKLDMSKSVFRHLRERAWRKYGSLDKVIQRVVLMKVVPDVIPSIHAKADLQVAFGQGAGIGDHGGEGGDVLTGVFLQPGQTVSQPQLTATTFHTDTRLYTILMVDPDAPCEETESFKTYAHWLVTDVPLSATANTIPSDLSHQLPYIPPHPQKGSPYHRYTTLLLRQPEGSPSSTSSDPIDRENFNVSDYILRNGLTPVGIHFWREIWSKENAADVSKIYSEILG
ncbi:PEBP-like protein, partial [Violaceomyces palustris]